MVQGVDAKREERKHGVAQQRLRHLQQLHPDAHQGQIERQQQRLEGGRIPSVDIGPSGPLGAIETAGVLILALMIRLLTARVANLVRRGHEMA